MALPVESHITFIVRDDDGQSDLLFQTSDTTWQAYNGYGGYSLYAHPGHAHKVSYNRPFYTRTNSTEDFFMNAEYPMLRWLERNGYDVSYFTDVDTDRYGSELLEHKVFLSIGHDEYWSAGQRAAVETARNAGKHLAFFSGNEIYWKTRWEPSTDGSDTPYRTLVSYKEGALAGGEHYTCAGNYDCDPVDPPVWTGLWRDGCGLAGHDGCLPENACSGQISWMGTTRAIQVSADDGKMRFWRNTTVASLAPGTQQPLKAIRSAMSGTGSNSRITIQLGVSGSRPPLPMVRNTICHFIGIAAARWYLVPAPCNGCGVWTAITIEALPPKTRACSRQRSISLRIWVFNPPHSRRVWSQPLPPQILLRRPQSSPSPPLAPQ